MYLILRIENMWDIYFLVFEQSSVTLQNETIKPADLKKRFE